MATCLVCEKKIRKRTRVSYRLLCNINTVGYHAEYLCFACTEDIAQQIRQIERIVAQLMSIYDQELKQYHLIRKNPLLIMSFAEFSWFAEPPINNPAKRIRVHLGPMTAALMLAVNFYRVCMAGGDAYDDAEYIDQYCLIVAQLILQGQRGRKTTVPDAPGLTIFQNE